MNYINIRKTKLALISFSLLTSSLNARSWNWQSANGGLPSSTPQIRAIASGSDILYAALQVPNSLQLKNNDRQLGGVYSDSTGSWQAAGLQGETIDNLLFNPTGTGGFSELYAVSPTSGQYGGTIYRKTLNPWDKWTPINSGSANSSGLPSPYFVTVSLYDQGNGDLFFASHNEKDAGFASIYKTRELLKRSKDFRPSCPLKSRVF